MRSTTDRNAFAGWEDMDGIRISKGSVMPMVGFGTWDVRGEEGRKTISRALEVGYRLIDTARMYGNESIVGEAIRESGIPREEIFVTTKIDRPYSGYGTARDAIRDSLERLGTDYIDLYLIHEPYDDSAEIYMALEEAMDSGYVRNIGVSNFSMEKIDEIMVTATRTPAVNQVESNVYYPQLEFKAKLANRGVVMQSWSPFVEGRRDIFNDPVLRRIGASHGKTVAQVALRYLVQNGIPVIPKSSTEEHMRENLDIFDFSLDDSELAEIAGLDTGKSAFGWYD